MHNGIPGDPGAGLESLLSYLEQAYYDRIEGICSRAEHHIATLHSGDVHQAASLYTSLSKKLIGQVAQYTRLRRFALIPYIKELLDKEDEGHDCRTCSSNCKVRHAAQIDSIHDAHRRMTETLERLKSVVSEDSGAGTAQAAVVAGLRKEMAELDTILMELFHLEECALVPQVIEAQTAIHAGS